MQSYPRILLTLLAVLAASCAYILSENTHGSQLNGPEIRHMLARPAALKERLFSRFSSISNKKSASSLATTSSAVGNMTKLPTYFVSHGGPNIMFEKMHPIYSKLQKWGQEITKIKPDAIVIVSGHWQADDDVVEVNVNESEDLIYDFYGFPPEYYAAKFPHRGSKAVAQNVMEHLTKAGIPTRAVDRAVDHGVWVPLRVAFPPSDPLTVPLVQISLFANPSPSLHYALGRALAPLREQNILVIGSGAAVHNLRDLRFTLFAGDSTPTAYAESFDAALNEAIVLSDPAEREAEMAGLVKRPDARRAHPSFDHLLPVYVAAGAGEGEGAERFATLLEGSLSWSSFRFGDVSA